jgi:hypothetical protein
MKAFIARMAELKNLFMLLRDVSDKEQCRSIERKLQKKH